MSYVKTCPLCDKEYPLDVEAFSDDPLSKVCDVCYVNFSKEDKEERKEMAKPK